MRDSYKAETQWAPPHVGRQLRGVRLAAEDARQLAIRSQAEAQAATDPDTAERHPNERLAYSVDEAAAITGLSRDLLYDQMRAGKLAYLKVGRRRIITRQHLEAFLAGPT